MRKEFVRTYLKRVAIMGPLVALVVILPPGPLVAKTAGIGAFLIILLLELLVEVLVIARNADGASAVQVGHGDLPAEPGTRRHHRHAQLSTDADMKLPRD